MKKTWHFCPVILVTGLLIFPVNRSCGGVRKPYATISSRVTAGVLQHRSCDRINACLHAACACMLSACLYLSGLLACCMLACLLQTCMHAICLLTCCMLTCMLHAGECLFAFMHASYREIKYVSIISFWIPNGKMMWVFFFVCNHPPAITSVCPW